MGRGPLTHEFAIPNWRGRRAGSLHHRAANGCALPAVHAAAAMRCYLLPARETLGHAELVAFLCECGDACTSRASGKGGVTVSTANTEDLGAPALARRV